MDGPTFEAIKSDIRDAVEKYIPNLTIKDISLTPYLDDLEAQGELNYEKLGGTVYKIPGKGTEEYTAKLRIDYSVDDKAFESKDFIIINI